MRLKILSDLHLEFSWEQQRSFITSIDPENIDVVILAGDICLHKQIVEALTLICQHFSESDVIWVHGNHEFYTSDRPTVLDLSRKAVAQNKNLHWLDGRAEVIRGQRFVGATMWFENQPENDRWEYYMNDFRVIGGFRNWVYEENLHATNLIEGTVNEDDVVITHHLPSPRSVATRFRMGELNRFYVCDMETFIKRRGPKLWVHGHTHDSFDYEIEHVGNTKAVTRVVCNPRGYFPHDINPDFNKDLVIEI